VTPLQKRWRGITWPSLKQKTSNSYTFNITDNNGWLSIASLESSKTESEKNLILVANDKSFIKSIDSWLEYNVVSGGEHVIDVVGIGGSIASNVNLLEWNNSLVRVVGLASSAPFNSWDDEIELSWISIVLGNIWFLSRYWGLINSSASEFSVNVSAVRSWCSLNTKLYDVPVLMV